MAADAPIRIQGDMGEENLITDLRALRRALEGGASVEKVVWRQGEAPPPGLWALVRRYHLPVQQVPAPALPSRSSWAAYLSPIKLYKLEECLLEEPQGVAIALVGISDVRNIGAIIRTAVAFGVRWMLLRARGMPLLSEEGIWRASAGALTHLRIIRTERLFQVLQQLKAQGWFLLATVPPHEGIATSYLEWDWQKPSLLLIGQEDQGLPPAYQQLCNRVITIPHELSVESLNVSVATGIILGWAYICHRRGETASIT